ncbi:MAG: thioredoxin family protein [Steroidobacteraceae bacterium]|jgi:thioredoxin 1
MKALLALVSTALILLAAPAMAGEQPYTAATLSRMLAAGQPVVVDFHADWCPTCRAQAPIVKDLLSTPELKNVTVLLADYDTELALRKSLKVANQSTFVVFRQGKEVARSTGDTTRDGLAALFKKAIS